MSATAYPLTWPAGRTRTKDRKQARFSSKGAGRWPREVTITEATARLLDELRRLGVDEDEVIVSTNLQLRRRDGLPKAGQSRPEDPGAAVYFPLSDRDGDGEDVCMACDRWLRVEDNIVAIAKSIEATRGLERWGAGTVREYFRGFRALPAAGETSKQNWWRVLGVERTATADEIRTRFKLLAAKHHPDVGGDRTQWDELQRARSEGLAAAALGAE